VFRTWAQDESVTRYLVWRPHRSIEESVAHAERCEEAWEAGRSFAWVLEDRDSGAPLGSIAAHRDGHRVALGYLLAPDAWGQGFMTEAVRAVADWWLEQPAIYRVWAVCDVENRASARVLERAGFELEGTLRRWMIHPNVSDEPRDALCWARVRA
jgi:RimJ/RimL family protein N-acetyltransferase